MSRTCPLALLVSMLIASSAAAATVGNRVRGATAAVDVFLEEAARRSPTIAAQMRALADSDLIVYVDLKPIPAEPLASTKIVSANRSARYLRVSIAAFATIDRIVLLGHELQHALEIAAAPDVRDGAGMQRLYRAIGTRRHADTRFETIAAMRINTTIRRELNQVAADVTPIEYGDLPAERGPAPPRDY
jgi:hypothetical protein